MSGAAALLAEITALTTAVRQRTWVAVELGEPTAPTAPPSAALSGLDGAGLGWLAPFVAFLREPLDQLSGDPAPVTCGAREYDRAGQDVLSAAATYRRAAGGGDSDDYADALAVLGAGCTAVASALAGAAEVVDRVARIVAGIAAEAVAEIVPVMTGALARSAATSGASVATAVPWCVGIAAAAGERIASTLAAWVASGRHLLELVAGAVAVMRAGRRVLSGISGQHSEGESG